MQDTHPKKTNSKTFSPTKRKYALLAVILLALVSFDLSTIGGNNIRLYAKWISCGRWPVETVGYIAGEVPSYQSAKGASLLLRGGAEYFCTPLEAERAGYSASPTQYKFPHLNE